MLQNSAFEEKAYYPSILGFPFAHSSSCSSLNPLFWGPCSPPAQCQCCTTFNEAEISQNNWEDHMFWFLSYTPDIILRCMWGDDQTVMFRLCIMSKRKGKINFLSVANEDVQPLVGSKA